LKSILIAALLAGSALSAVHAAEPAQKLRPLIGMNLTFGGDKLFDSEFSDGRDATVHAGGGFAFFGGAEYSFTDTVAMQATLGYHTDRINASNGGARFSRVPVNVLGVYSFGKFRVGAGVEVATSANYSADGAAGNADIDFKSSVGPVVEGEYLFSNNFSLKLRAAQHTFKVKAAPSVEADGNYFGLQMGYTF
jgi:opacity protein-like surface antigen